MFGNILFGCLRQVGCLKEVTANSGLTGFFFVNSLPMVPNVTERRFHETFFQIPKETKVATSDGKIFSLVIFTIVTDWLIDLPE